MHKNKTKTHKTDIINGYGLKLQSFPYSMLYNPKKKN